MGAGPGPGRGGRGDHRGRDGGGGRGGGGDDDGRRTVGLRESRPGAIDPIQLGLRPPPSGPPVLVAIVQIQFRDAGRVYAFDSGDRYYTAGTEVVVETDRGQAVGKVVRATERRVQPAEGLLRVVRVVDENDRRAIKRSAARESDALKACLEMVRRARLDMKLIRAEYLHSGTKIVFYFSSEDRVDFRDLVRDLGARLQARVEMRQIGVRDRSKLVGGIGSCGRDLCCKTWLRDFEPVSIKMAKDQNLALNPQKISGQCGRLKCCLGYEEDTYREMRKGLPRVGKLVLTPKGQGRVRELDVLRHLVRVSFEMETETFPADQVKLVEGDAGGGGGGGAGSDRPRPEGGRPEREGGRGPDRNAERTRRDAQRYAKGGATPVAPAAPASDTGDTGDTGDHGDASDTGEMADTGDTGDIDAGSDDGDSGQGGGSDSDIE